MKFLPRWNTPPPPLKFPVQWTLAPVKFLADNSAWKFLLSILSFKKAFNFQSFSRWLLKSLLPWKIVPGNPNTPKKSTDNTPRTFPHAKLTWQRESKTNKKKIRVGILSNPTTVKSPPPEIALSKKNWAKLPDLFGQLERLNISIWTLREKQNCKKEKEQIYTHLWCLYWQKINNSTFLM